MNSAKMQNTMNEPTTNLTPSTANCFVQNQKSPMPRSLTTNHHFVNTGKGFRMLAYEIGGSEAFFWLVVVVVVMAGLWLLFSLLGRFPR